MKINLIKIVFITIAIIIISGCSSKTVEEQEYNKPAVYWYNKMIKQISNYQYDSADETFLSLESEHRRSPLLPTAIMIIATAHMENEEYEMANYYYDEYLKRYSSKQNVDYVRYLKIKANFLAFKSQYRDQELLSKTLNDVSDFIGEYKNSKYIYLAKDIESRLLMAQATLDNEIAELYGRLEKTEAQKIYESKAKKSWMDINSIKKVEVPFYRYIFE
ncbi:MAG: outer membrane protein assembly factor BamD [Campylobacterota bacterium]|nr:outer membrane protein assembly factor BamD [Campylobacterota bacterium]